MASYRMQRQLLARSAQQISVSARFGNSHLPSMTATCPTASRSFTSLPQRLREIGQNFTPDRLSNGPNTHTTISPPTAEQPLFTEEAPPPPKPPRRRLRLFSSIFFIICGSSLYFASHPPEKVMNKLLERSEAKQKRNILREAENLPLLKQLLANPSYTHHEAYASYTQDPTSHSASRLTTGPLANSLALTFQHIFHNTTEPEVLNIINFGLRVWGWPGTVHGGMLATIIDEHGARGALADPAIRAQDKGVVTASLDITYKRRTLAEKFYVVRARPVPDEKLPVEQRGKRDRKMWVEVQVEDLQGELMVTAKALYVVPKGTELKAVPEQF